MTAREEQIERLMKDGLKPYRPPRFRPPTAADDDVYEERLAICAQCPMYSEDAGQYEGKLHGPNACLHCGCDMTKWARLQFAKCKDKANPRW